ncbi:acyltransferase [Vibrio sp. S9_S30]|uniref:acyltransferase family protein n=1 Tax=Vibrio sp. S9_S30 TaxID=2720226 RepID=UPI001681ABEF|nr:acyltransferase [Vibrio sp. S9_S30]
MKNRTDWVDYAKGIGILLVVYGHVARGLFNAKIDMPAALYFRIDSAIYSFHMPLFFFLSGLFFYHSFSKRGTKKLMFSKVDTIFYPYVLWSLLQGSIEAVLSTYTNGNVSFSDVLALLWAPRAQFWFLYALFFAFLVSSIVYTTASKPLGGGFFVITVLLYVFASFLPDFTFIKLLSKNLVFFILGIIFTQYRLERFLTSGAALGATFVLFVFVQWGYHDLLGLDYRQRGAESLIVAICSIAFVTSLSITISKGAFGFLKTLGAASMAIYVMHVLAGSGVRVVLTKGMGIESVSIHLVLGMVVATLAPLAAYQIIERFRIPFILSAPISRWFQPRSQ